MRQASVRSAPTAAPYRITVSDEAGPAVFDCQPDDVLLRAGLRAGLALPYGCNVGACGSCKFQLLDGEVATAWTEATGLTALDRARRRHLACQARPLADCAVRFLGTAPEARQTVLPTLARCRLTARRALTHDLYLLSFAGAQAIGFQPGQYALLHLAGVDGPRAYSMANIAGGDGRLDFIVKLKAGGIGSDRACRSLDIGDTVQIDAPYGFAGLRPDHDRDVVCVAGGSGLGPMLSILRGFLADPGFRERRLWFLLGVRALRDAFDLSEFCGDGVSDPRLTFVTTFSDSGQERTMVHQALPSLGFRPLESQIYLGGPPAMISACTDTLRAMGVPSGHIHCDEFY